MKILLEIIILLLVTMLIYYGLGAFFMWDSNWMANTMPNILPIDRGALLLLYGMLLLGITGAYFVNKQTND